MPSDNITIAGQLQALFLPHKIAFTLGIYASQNVTVHTALENTENSRCEERSDVAIQKET